MGWRDRLARAISPAPFKHLDEYAEIFPGPMLELARSMRGVPLELLPPGFNLLNFGSDGLPNMQQLLSGAVGASDFGTRALANRLGTLRPVVKVRKKLAPGTVSEELVDDHVYQKLIDRPHPSFSRRAMLSLTGWHLVLGGEAYWNKIRNGFGLVSELQILPPAAVAPVVRKGVITSYQVRIGGGEILTIKASEIMRFWLPDHQTLYRARGYIEGSWTTITGAAFADQHMQQHFEHDATPATFLQGQPGATAPGDLARKAFELLWRKDYHARAGMARGTPAWIPPGWTLEGMNVQKGNQIVPLLEFYMRMQLMNLGVPASVLGLVVSGDRSSAETNQFVFDMHSIKPLADVIADTLTLGLTAELDERLFFDFEDFISNDKDFELRKDETDIRAKIRSPKQIIEDRGGDPERAPWGDFPPGSLADAPYTGEVIEQEPAGPPDAEEDPEMDEAEEDEPTEGTPNQAAAGPALARLAALFSPLRGWRRALARRARWEPAATRAARRVFTLQEQMITEAVRSFPGGLLRAVIEEVLSNPALGRLWERIFEPVRTAAFRASGQEALDLLGSGNFELTATAVKRLERYGAQMVTRVDNTTRARLREEIALSVAAGEGVGQLASRINSVFGVRRANAPAIARTEMLRATEDAQIEGFRQSEVVEKKRWNDSQDDRVRESHIEGGIAVVALNESFTLRNGRQAEFPGDPQLPPEDSVNCRCFVTPEFE